MGNSEPPLVLAVGQPCPLPYPRGFGAGAQFLQASGNLLQVIIPDMRPEEIDALRQGRLRAGLLQEGSAILLLFELSNPQGEPILVFDCPFDLRRVPSAGRDLPDLEQPLKTRMMI